MSRDRRNARLVVGIALAGLVLGLGCTKTKTKTRTLVEDLQIVTTSLPPGQVGIFYFGLAEASGGTPPIAWSIEPGSSLPTGITLDPKGLLAGIPTSTGTFFFDLRVTDSAPLPESRLQTFSITNAAGAPLAITTTSPLPSGNVAFFYSVTIMSSGGFGTHTLSVTNGNLPAGLSMNGASGIISGFPQVAALSTFEITVTDSQAPVPDTASATFDLTIDPGIPADHLLVNEINTASGFAEVLNPTATDQDMTGWSMDFYWYGIFINRYYFPSFVLPAGEVVGVAGGSGTDFTTPPLFLVFTGWYLQLRPGDEQEVILYDDTGAGVDYLAINDVGTATHLPAGLNWSGVFNQDYTLGSQTHTDDVIRTSYVDTDSATDLMAVVGSGTNGNLNPGQGPTSIILTSVVLWDGYTALPYYQKLVTLGGLPPYTYSAPTPVDLPPGLIVDPVDGAIVGTPTSAGTYQFMVETMDSFGPPATDTQQITINILAAMPGFASDIKLNEVDYGDPDWIEVKNRGAGAVDISGWYLQVMFESSGPTGHIINVAIPRGVVLPAGQTLYIPEGGTGFISQFEMGMGLYLNVTSAVPGAVSLVDSTFMSVDYMEWNGPTVLPMPMGVVWTGGGLVASGNENFARSESAGDTDSDADWCTGAAGSGTPAADNTNCP